MSLSPTTELEAINTMLTSIGELPVQNKEDLAGLQDASIAQSILTNVSRATQAKGWVFNTDLEETMSLDKNKQVPLGKNVLRIDTTARVRGSKIDIVERGRKLYDRQKKTFTFDADDVIKCDVVYYLSFEDLPEPARRYIAIKSARIFHDRVVGSGELHRFYQEDEMRAYTDLMSYEGDVADYNIFDNYDVYRVMDRQGLATNPLNYNVIDTATT